MGLIFTNIPELEGSDTEVVLSNLSELEREFEELVEKRFAHISELACAVIADGEDFDIIKSILLSTLSDGVSEDGHIIDENRRSAALVYSKMSLCERLILYRHICKNYHSKYKKNIYEKNFSVRPDGGRIAYVKNSYNDEAYLKLSVAVSDPKAIYFDGAAAVCEALAEGECEYCILPTESDGIKLASFYDFIKKYALVRVCEYDLATDGGYTRYSLLRCGEIDFGVQRMHKGRMYAEICVPAEEAVSVSDIMVCGEFCMMGIQRIDTIDGNIFISFRADRCDINTFMMYLEIECPSAKIMGIYKNIQ